MSNQNTSQEIDLSLMFKKVSSFFGNLFYKIIYFAVKNVFILIGLVIVGVAVGYFLDKQQAKSYKHEVIIIPNFESSTYLYKEIRNKTLEKNSPIIAVDIEPIIDVYQFVSADNNLKIAEYLSENNIKIQEYKPNNQAEKIYQHHLLTIYTNKKDTDGSIVNEFLRKLNQVPYFSEKQKIEAENIKIKIQENETSIKDINAIFEKLGAQSTSAKSEVNIEMNSQVNDLQNNKRFLVEITNRLKIKQMEQSKIFYDVSVFSNIKVKSTSKMMIIPVLLILAFIGFVFVKSIYKKYILNINES